jgi:hypothetical protein
VTDLTRINPLAMTEFELLATVAAFAAIAAMAIRDWWYYRKAGEETGRKERDE